MKLRSHDAFEPAGQVRAIAQDVAAVSVRTIQPVEETQQRRRFSVRSTLDTLKIPPREIAS